VSRVLPADENDGDLLQIFRFLDAARLSELHFRNPRSFVLAEKVVFEQNNPGNPEAGVLRVTGYVRGGSGLSCDSLVHIPGLGDLQLDRVTDLESGVVLHSATDLRPSLQAENEPDPFAGGEQTWPTAADVEMAGLSDEEEGEDAIQEAVKGRKLRRRIPAGMSDYQAAWLPESDEEEEEDEEDEDEDHQVKQMDESSGGEEVPPKQMYNSDEEDEKKNDDAMKDDDDDEDNVVEKERDEQRWPDEVEAPHDMPARERFQKYRGLDSFRTAAWDPRENLPVEYSRIFQLANYAHFVRRNGQPLENPPIQTGAHVVLHLQCPARLAAVVGALAHRPLVIGTLLKHENKISVLHFDVMKHHDFTEPVASGETLIACFGLHRLQVVPIFSQHVPGCEKCKYERFLPSGASAMSMASFFGPITISPCSITLFRMVDGVPVLVASGTLRTANSDLLLIKKVVLTAHPSRVHKRTAVCKVRLFCFVFDLF
jgi:pre-rRNA-processing protein TSR1